jgi:DNA-binding XRE family transcriptional regulator
MAIQTSSLSLHANLGDQRGRLGTFLLQRRRRVDAGAARIGPLPRRPERIGRRVTQEEIAEAVEVTREWYAMIEAGAAVRPSTSLLARLATVFELSTDERLTLFMLGIEELRPARS